MRQLIQEISGVRNQNTIIDKSTKTLAKYHVRVPQKERSKVYESVTKSLKSKKIKYEEKLISSESSTTPCINFEYDGKNYRVVVKPQGGGSGAGARVTAIGESAQCLYLAALRNNAKNYTNQELESAFAKCDTDIPVTDIIKELDEGWIQSSIRGAKLLDSKLPKKQYVYHRGSKWVNGVEAAFKRINKVDRPFDNINKWTPADIWIVEKGTQTNWDQFNNFVELNTYLEDMFDKKKIIGVSLKKITSGNGKYSIKNKTGVTKPIYKYTGYTLGKTFFNSKDVYITFDGGKVQLRTFGVPASSWQAEIKGESANQGKMGGGGVQRVVSRVTGSTLTTPSTIKVTKQYLDNFYKYFNKISDEKIDYEDFVSQTTTKVSESGLQWFISKYLGAEIIYTIENYNNPTKVVSELLSYASSQSELSCIYAKVE